MAPKVTDAVIPWANTLKRLRETCSEYVETKKDLGVSQSVQKKRKPEPGTLALERFLKKLLFELKIDNLEMQPTETQLQVLDEKLEKGIFGADLTRIRKLFTTFPNLPIHSVLIKRFMSEQTLKPDELLLLEELKKDKTIRFAIGGFRVSLNVLRKLRQENVPLRKLGDIKTMDAQKFCAPTNKICVMRILLLMLCGNSSTKAQLTLDAQSFLQIKKKGYALCKTLKLPPKSSAPIVYIRLWELFGVPLEVAIEKFSTEKIINVLTSMNEPQLARILITHVAQEQQKVELIKSLELTNKLNQIDTFAGMSEWHAKIVADLRQREKNNSTTSYAKEHIDVMSRKFGGFALYLDAEARKISNNHAQSLPDFLKKSSEDDLLKIIQGFLLSKKVCNDRIKSEKNEHHCDQAAGICLRFLKGVFREHIGCINFVRKWVVRDLTFNIPNLRIIANGTKRRTFTDDEVNLMMQAASNPVEILILTLLREIGLRNAALCHLRYDSILDKNHQPYNECSVAEKSGKTRYFITSANLKTKIKECSNFLRKTYGSEKDLKDCYLLNWKNLSEPMGPTQLGHLLNIIGHNAGITDVEIHAHAFRHTLVTKLCLLNPISIVSKFIGHDDVRTTSYFYFKPTLEQIDKNLKNPFSENFQDNVTTENNKKILIEAANEKILATRKILDVLLNNACEEMKLKMLTIIPNYQEILNAVDIPTCIEDLTINNKTSTASSMNDFE